MCVFSSFSTEHDALSCQSARKRPALHNVLVFPLRNGLPYLFFAPPSHCETTRRRIDMTHTDPLFENSFILEWRARIQGGRKGRTPPPIFGLAVPNLSPTLHARTQMTPPAPPPFSNPRSAPGMGISVCTCCRAVGAELGRIHVEQLLIHFPCC